MPSHKFSRVVATATIAGSLLAFGAQNAVASGPLKVGYVSLDQIKQQMPELANADVLRLQGESQMQQAVGKANEELAKAQKENKPKDEITCMQRDFQNQISGMQQGIQFAVNIESLKLNQRVHQVAEQVAKDKGLDVVIDSSTIFAGGEKLVASGENITDVVLKQLQAKPAPTKP